MKKVKVALVQSHWKNNPEENFKSALQAIKRIADRGPIDLICFPEFFTGAPWYFPGRGHLKGIVDDTIPGKMTEEMGQLAKKYNTYILSGTIVEREKEHYFNTSVLLDNQGQIVGKARKIHRYSAELISVKQGTEQLLVDTPFGKVGVCVCSDFWIQEMPRMLALQGAEIICVPGASLTQNLQLTHPLILANSVHNVCYTLYTSVVGSITGERAGRSITINLGGYTTIASPGKILAALKDEESVLYAELDMEHLRKLREVDLSFKNSLYWCLWGRMPELYQGILKPYVGAKEDLKALIADYLEDQKT